MTKSCNVVNDSAERGVKLSSDFLAAAHSEKHYQNVLQVVEQDRKKDYLRSLNWTKTNCTFIQNGCYSPEKWLHNWICHPSNRSKQIQESHTAYSADTQPTRQSLNVRQHTRLHRQLTCCLWSHVCCFSFKLCRVYCVPALEAVWVSWICLDRLLGLQIQLCNHFSSE